MPLVPLPEFAGSGGTKLPPACVDEVLLCLLPGVVLGADLGTVPAASGLDPFASSSVASAYLPAARRTGSGASSASLQRAAFARNPTPECQASLSLLARSAVRLSPAAPTNSATASR